MEAKSKPLLPPLQPPLKAESEGTILNSSSARYDGRMVHEMRDMAMRCLSLKNASGGAFISFGKTRTSCAVFGPRPRRGGRKVVKMAVNSSTSVSGVSVSGQALTSATAARSRKLGGESTKGEIIVDITCPRFAFTPETWQLTDRQTNQGSNKLEDRIRLLHLQISEAISCIIDLSKYPRSVVHVSLVIVCDDGGVLPTAMSCVALALADAKIEMIDIFAAATVHAIKIPRKPTALSARRKTKQDPHRVVYLIDMDETELRMLPPSDVTSLTLGFCPRKSAAFLHASGDCLSPDDREVMLDLATRGASAIAGEMHACLKEKAVGNLERLRQLRDSDSPTSTQ
eukprot:GHVO01052965.1.p1 GENE.GHVO01052965.1~~GHVO01052965.1.p1  ORF type:complete len:342 (+),score=42.75 GHVO01052965.1:617-1642(+)